MEGAKEHFGVTEVRVGLSAFLSDPKALLNTDLEATIQGLARRAKTMLHDSLSEDMVSAAQKANPSLQIGDAEKTIEHMRVVKSPAGIVLLLRSPLA